MAEAVILLLQELGEIPGELKESIKSQADLEILSQWIKLAATAESVEEFIEKAVTALKK